MPYPYFKPAYLLLTLLGSSTLPVQSLAQTQSSPHVVHHDHSSASPISVDVTVKHDNVIEKNWTAVPLITSVGRIERTQAIYGVKNLNANAVEIYTPAQPTQFSSTTLEKGIANLTPPDSKQGNYHLLIARETRALPDGKTEQRLASSAWYISNPGLSPRALLAAERPGLSVLPQPIPREHGSYREGETWNFIVRLAGKAIPGAVVKLETQNGTKTRAVANLEGQAAVLFPRDFPESRQEGGHGRPPGTGFAVSVDYTEGNTHYISAFNGTYYPDPMRQRSLAWGGSFLLLGMLLGLPLLRHTAAPATAKPEKENDHA